MWLETGDLVQLMKNCSKMWVKFIQERILVEDKNHQGNAAHSRDLKNTYLNECTWSSL